MTNPTSVARIDLSEIQKRVMQAKSGQISLSVAECQAMINEIQLARLRERRSRKTRRTVS